MVRCSHYRSADPQTHSVQYQIGEISVAVRCPYQEVLNDVRALYCGCPTGSENRDKVVGIEVRETGRSWLGRSSCRVFGDGQPFGPEVHRRQILPFVEWGINARLVAKRRDLLLVHAATLAYRGRGAIFAADSGSGKSTLAMALLARGWRYLSDEVALINPDTLEVHPFPKALCLKSGAFELARQLGLRFAGGRYYVTGAKGPVGYVNPREVGRHSIVPPTSIRLVVLPKYTPGCGPRLRRISGAQGAFALARHAMNRSAFGNRALEIIAGVVHKAECFVLESGPLDATCALLERLALDG